MKNQARIEWEYDGKTDYSSGTGAYTTEKALGLASAVVVPVFVLYLVFKGSVEWNALQLIVALMLAMDISGGLVSNALNSCKRFYHTPPLMKEGRLGFVLKHPILFSVMHLHPVIAALLLGERIWTYGFMWYILFIVSVVLVLRTPLYLQRPVSMLLIMLAFLVNGYIIEPIAGFEWLMPLLFIKIVYGHLVREEPYRR